MTPAQRKQFLLDESRFRPNRHCHCEERLARRSNPDRSDAPELCSCLTKPSPAPVPPVLSGRDQASGNSYNDNPAPTRWGCQPPHRYRVISCYYGNCLVDRCGSEISGGSLSFPIDPRPPRGSWPACLSRREFAKGSHRSGASGTDSTRAPSVMVGCRVVAIPWRRLASSPYTINDNYRIIK